MTTELPPNREAASFCQGILRSLDKIMACLEGLDEYQLNWRPPAEGANSVYGIAQHTLTSAEKYLLKLLGGHVSIGPHREEEFLWLNIWGRQN